ncbi:MAG: hypothetical protein EOO42_17430 [Flavobacteriales bacterium]|nr:MAG: hypothetical protein EOO42_17430 [Flavobacteriales bacterium]
MAPQAPSAALLSKAKQFYAEKISIENEKNRKISSTNIAKGKTKQIARFPPLWESASTSVNAAGQQILSVPLAKYLIDNKEIDYERSVVFEENNGAIVSGGITEVLGTPQSISENGLLLATGSINAKEINFTGYIINYDLNYQQTNGRQFKDGKQTAGEVTITQLPDNQLDKKGLNSIKTLGNKTTNRQNSSANPKNPISSFEPEIEGGQSCDNVYLAYIEKDDWGNITYIEIIRFLYVVCTGYPVGQQPPGGTEIYEDCAGEPNGTASDQNPCNTCIGGTTGLTECPPEIINEVIDTCLKKVVDSALTNNVIGKIKDIISKLDNNANVKIKIYDAQQTTTGAPATTSGSAWDKDSNGKIIGFSTNITLSRDLLVGSSKEHTAAVLLHEVLHAYFRESTGKKEAFDGLDHQTISEDYIEPIAKFLADLFDITLLDATALAWDGVIGSDAYKNATQFTIGSGNNAATISKQDLANINTSYVLKINGKGQGTCQ